MESQINILLVEGNIEDQIIEMAQYIDNRKGTSPNEGLALEVEKLVDDKRNEEAMEKIVAISGVLSSSPEREFIPSYNLLIHLVRNSPEPQFKKHLATLLENLSSPPTTSPANGPALAISVLSTLYNVLPVDSHERYDIYRGTLRVVAANGLYDLLAPQLPKVEAWIKEWKATVEEERDLYITIAGIAQEAGDSDQFYYFLVKALQAFEESESASGPARELAVRLVKAAINLPSRLDLDELAAMSAVVALQSSDPELFQLFEVFAGGQLEDYIEFNDEHEGWVEDNGIDHEAIYRKIRLLTLTSLAATCPDRSLPYNIISRRLHVPEEDVELWVIDVIRAGLVEGKLSQLNQTFLIHRANSRNFGRTEWEEVASRLDVWKQSLRGILDVIKAGREQAKLAEIRDQQKIEGQLGGLEGGGNMGGGDNRRRGRGNRDHQQQQQQQLEAEA